MAHFGRLGETLNDRSDQYVEHRSKLRVALEGFRKRIMSIIAYIPRDMPGFTVHDITHLDALWEMADLILGDEYELNPAEAFVLGGAILLHDAGMTLAAFKGGRAEVEKSVEFSSSKAFAKSNIDSEKFTDDERDALASNIALQETLRTLHPQVAQNLATQEWKSPTDGSSVFLINDDDLRSHYGQTIGRIAHSHHWGRDRLLTEFPVQLGAAPDHPPSWSVDPLKIALILRCADAAHLDARRAPTMSFAIERPKGVSAKHWTFQSLISKPVVQQGKLVYSSTADFDLEKSESWQLAYDALKVVDEELRGADDINDLRKHRKFAARGVQGVGSTEELSKYVRVVGWKPVSLNLRVSNVPHLARTLGGSDLYSSVFAPLRELLQNAADSIETRAAIDPDFQISSGRITFRISDDTIPATTIEIIDNGVGMSDKVLSGPLLDFGFSFWRSSEARREFPKLNVDNISPRGRFGIGFFSVFMWTDDVEVTSRVYTHSANETHVLHFRGGLGARPILRCAESQEQSMAWSTRVRLRLSPATTSRLFEHQQDSSPANRRFRRSQTRRPSNWTEAARMLCATLPIRVEVESSSDVDVVSYPKWRTMTHDEFFRSFRSIMYGGEDPIISQFSKGLSDVIENGVITGRLFIIPYGAAGSSSTNSVAVYDRGIFAGMMHSPSTFGIVEGRVTNAARERFETSSYLENEHWISAAVERAFSCCSHPGEELSVQRSLLSMGFFSDIRPLFMVDRKLVSKSEMIKSFAASGTARFVLKEGENETFSFAGTDSMEPLYGLKVDPRRVYSLVDIPGVIHREVEIDVFVKNDSSLLASLLRDFRSSTNRKCMYEMQVNESGGYRTDTMVVSITTR